jgi:hypothetical protein
MKRNAILFFAFAACFGGAAKAQYYGSGSTVNYKVLRDDPDRIRPVVVTLDVLATDTWNTSSYLGYGLRADVNVLKYGSVLVDYRKGYLGDKQRAVEIGGALNLLSARRKKATRVVLSSSSFAYAGKLFTSASSVSIPAIRKTVLQARGGIASFKSPISASGKDADGFVMTKDTNVVVISDFGKNYKGVYGFAALLKMQTYFAGLSIRSIRNIVISHDRGLGSNANNYNFYADVLLGGDPEFSGVTYEARSLATNGFPTGTSPSEYTLSAPEVKNLGWRLGWEAKTNNGFGLSYKAEFGSRPGYVQGSGILKSNNYLMLAAGFSIGVGKSYRKMTPQEKE